jgi:hypothetical protein
MKLTSITLFLLTFSVISFGQNRELTDEDYNSSGAAKVILEKKTSRAKELAKQDIEKGIPFLFLQSGVVPVRKPGDSIFESQFEAYYYEQGCTRPDKKFMEAYNIEIFEFLDREYGEKWRKSIRRDVIGFKKWR